MADYYPLLAKAVAGLPQSTADSRRVIYERARRALLGQLRSISPPVPDVDIDRESQALDDAIAQIERELAPAEPAPIEIPAAPEPVLASEPSPPPPVAPPPPLNEVTPPEPAKITVESEPIAAEPSVSDTESPVVSAPPFVAPEPPHPAKERPAAPRAPDFSAERSTSIPRPAIRPIPPIPPRPPMPSLKGRIPAPIKPFEAPRLEPETARLPELKIDSPQANDSATSIDSFPPLEITDEPPTRIEQIRPSAPQPPAARNNKMRYGILALVLVVIVAGIAALAVKLKDRPEEILRSKPQQTTAEQPESPNKIVERIGAGQAPTAPVRPAQNAGSNSTRPSDAAPAGSIPVAQRAAMLVDAPEEPQKFKTFVGSSVWKLESVNRGQGQPLTQAVRAEADLGDSRMKVTILLQLNTDDNLPASHTMTIRFAPAPDSPFPQVDEIDMPQMRNEVSPSVDSLFGVVAKITQGMFLIGFSREPTLLTRNLEMLKMRGWLDIPMRLADGRIAKITIEKGPAGDRIVNDAFTAWGQ